MFSSRAVLRAAIPGLAVAFMVATSALLAEGTAEVSRPALGKLATALAEMARAYAPQAPPAPALRGPAPPAFSLESMPKSVRDAVRTRLMRMNPQGEVQVYIFMNPVSDERLRELAAHGVTIEITDVAGHRVQARTPVARLEEVAGLSFVDQIRLPCYAHRMTGLANSEGDAILRSDLARAQLGLTGAGVRVGVISDGIKGVFATGCTTCGGVADGPISSLDLPASIGTRSALGVLNSSSGGISGRSFSDGNDLEGITPGCAFAGAGAEGTALLEIVHDIAPGAQLSFANIDTDLAMNQAVNFLAASNDVVVDDLGFFGLPSDGTSTVSTNTASALNQPGNRIRGYYTSAGNGAFNHYFGAYTNSGVNGNSISSGITSSGNVHLFSASGDTSDVLALGQQTYNLIKLPADAETIVFLTWNDPAGASTNNYEMFLVQQSTGQVVASDICKSFFGPQEPTRCVAYANTGAEDFFRIVVQNVSNAAQIRNLNMFVLTPQCAAAGVLRLAPPNHARLNFVTPTRSLSAQSDSGGSPASVVSVGAICSASDRTQLLFTGSPAPFQSCFDTTNEILEHFSAQGPTIDNRMKPDVTSIDGVSITGAGNFPCSSTDPNCSSPFFGTSASAPHVAGMAALVLESAPCLIRGKPGALGDVAARTSLRNLILDNAVPLGGTVPNNIFGHGRADALASIEQALPTFGVVSSISVSGNTPAGVSLTPAQLGFSDPNSCPLTTLNWSGDCGTGPGATMPCPFGPSNVIVGASNNGVTFSAPASVQITVTNFTVGGLPASQTVVAGDPATYTVTVSAVGGAYSNSITLGCSNLPAETSCAFDPPAVAPGAGSATSTLTITTTPRPPSAASAPIAPMGAPNRLPPQLVFYSLLVAAAALGLQIHRFRIMALGRRRRQPGMAARLASLRPRLGMALAEWTLAVTLLAWLGLQISCGASITPTPPSPGASLSPASLTFDAQGVGTTSGAKTATLTSTGNALLTITGISASGDFAQTNNCGSSLAAGANCAINVTITPTAGGTRTGAVSVTSNAGTRTTNLSGTGLAGTAVGSYPVTVMGTAGTLVNSGVVTLDVQ